MNKYTCGCNLCFTYVYSFCANYNTHLYAGLFNTNVFCELGVLYINIHNSNTQKYLYLL